FFFSSRRRHARLVSDWSSDVCSSDLSLCVSETTPRLPPRALLIVPGPVVTDDASQIVRNFFPEFLDSSWAGMYHDSVQNITNARSEERRVGKEWRDRGAREQ